MKKPEKSKRFCYDYPRPMVTVDCVCLRLMKSEIEVLLIQRKHPPFQGDWALPGGFIEMEETLEQAARREMVEETGLTEPRMLRPIWHYADPGRDPRGRVISFAFLALFEGAPSASAGEDAAEAKWFPLREAVRMAFDHEAILRDALYCFRMGLQMRGWLAYFLPKQFRVEDMEPAVNAVPGFPMTAEKYVHQLAGAGLLKRVRPKGTYELRSAGEDPWQSLLPPFL